MSKKLYNKHIRPRRRILIPLAGVFLLFAVIIATNVLTFKTVTNGGGNGPVGQKPKADVSVINDIISEKTFTYRVVITDLEKEVRSYLVTLIKVGGGSKQIADQFYEPFGGVTDIDHQLTATFFEGAGAYQLKLEVSDMDYNYDSDIIVLEYAPESGNGNGNGNGGTGVSGFELFFGLSLIILIIKRKR